jgi:hypothetical protein
MPPLTPALSSHFHHVLETPLTPLHLLVPAIGQGEICTPQSKSCPCRPRDARTRMDANACTPEHGPAPSPQSSPRHQRLPEPSPHLKDTARHRLRHSRALWPTPSSTTSAGPVTDIDVARTLRSTVFCAIKRVTIAKTSRTAQHPRLALSPLRPSSPWTTRACPAAPPRRYK